VLVTENAALWVSRGARLGQRRGGLPDSHTWARHGWELDGARETLVTLRVIVLEADLEFDGLEEVALLLVLGVVQELLHIGADAGDCDFRHIGSLPEESK
jgi:hypothetical protein